MVAETKKKGRAAEERIVNCCGIHHESIATTTGLHIFVVWPGPSVGGEIGGEKFIHKCMKTSKSNHSTVEFTIGLALSAFYLSGG